MTEISRKEVMASLKAGYIFILLPFVVLTLIKILHHGSWEGVLLSADWALASCIIFGQNAASLTKAALGRRGNVHANSFIYIFSRRLLGVAISLVIYILMLLEPNLWIGSIQLILFSWASVKYFTDGMASAMLKEES
jgi:hypothetical protein